LKIKLEGRHFDRTERNEVESQAVLNTFIEHSFQDAFKKMAEALGTVHARGSGLLQWKWWPVGPKLFFDQIAAQVLKIMDDFYMFLCNSRLMYCIAWPL
jgi:hypothetical protein